MGNRGRSSFEELTRDSAAEALRMVLGASGFDVLQRRFGLNDVMSEGDSLHSLLDEVFGTSGAVVIERQVLREIVARTQVSLDLPPMERFEASLQRIKESLSTERGSG